MSAFVSWLADVLQEDKSDVNLLLQDETALHFLIAWSLFESKCFSGFLKVKDLISFADEAVQAGFAPLTVVRQLNHFHGRYGDRKKLDNLLSDKKTPAAVLENFKRCLASQFSSLADRDRVFTVLFVIYRFRNNIFHGNKRVESWLQYREQISLCTEAMQKFVAHAERVKPTMHFPVAT